MDNTHCTVPQPLPAFRIWGNLFFVGNQDAASYLLSTPEGLVLFDTNYPSATPQLLQSIRSCGFAPEEIRWILHTHGHYDHMGATTLLWQLSGARLFLGRADRDLLLARPELSLACEGGSDMDLRFLKSVEPLEDGQSLLLGDTVVKAVATPGHTPGAMSYFFSLSDGDTSCRVGLHGGAGLNTLTRTFQETYGVNWRGDFAASLEKLLHKPVDLFLGNHTAQNHTLQRLARLQRGEKNAFIDAAAWDCFLLNVQSQFRALSAKE